MMNRLRITGLVAILALAPFSASAQVADTKVLSDQILPKDTYLYISVPSVQEMKANFQDSSLNDLWNDPAMQDFKDEVSRAFETELQEGMLQIQEAVGLTVEEMMQIPEGEVSLAMCAGPSNTMGFAFFLDYGDNEEALQEALRRATDALSSQERLVSADTSFDGTEITMFEVSYPGKAPTPLAKEFGWFLKDQRMVFSNRLRVMESILQNWDGESDDTFVTNDTYAYVLETCSRSPEKALSKIYVDPIGLVKKLITTGSLGQQASAQGGMLLGFLPMLGLEQMKGMGAVSEPGEGDFETITRSVFFVDQPPMALMRAMQLGEISSTPPEWVKEDVHGYVATSWKLDEAYTAIEALVDPFIGGPGTLKKRMDAMARQSPEIHPKDDVIDQLTGEIQILLAPGESATTGDQTLIAMGVRDATRMNNTLMKISDVLGMESREFRGATIFEADGPDQMVQLSTINNVMLFSVGTSLLEQVLRNDSDIRPLSETDAFQRIAEHLPANALSVQFSRPAEQYRPVYEMLRDGTAAEQLPGMDDIFEKIDFTTLPPFQTVSQYIHPTGGYTVEDEKGWYMESFQLRD